MATQNIAPPDHRNSQKGAECPNAGSGDGQSVSKRLQQDLMTLMVGMGSSFNSIYLYIIASYLSAINMERIRSKNCYSILFFGPLV